jgi:hypothetical protein
MIRYNNAKYERSEGNFVNQIIPIESSETIYFSAAREATEQHFNQMVEFISFIVFNDQVIVMYSLKE